MARLGNNDYLKLFQMKNAMHDQDREKASSLLHNLVAPSRRIVQANPYLNHTPKEEPSLNMVVEDLV